MATPVNCGRSIPRVLSSVWMKTPYSSAVCSRRVVRRHDTSRRGPLKTPIFVLVLPTSMTTIIGGLQGHVAPEDSYHLPIVRPNHQRAVVGQVDGHPHPPVARPGAAAYALGALEPRLAEALHAHGEKARVPAIEGGQHCLSHPGEIVDVSGLHSYRGGERGQRLDEGRLVDVQSDTQDEVTNRSRPRGGRFG